MTWTHRGKQVTIVPPNTKHRVEYWVNEEKSKVIYTWYNAHGGTVRIVEWDYSDRLKDEETVLNRLRFVVGMDKKIKSFAGLSVGTIKERIETTDIKSSENLFEAGLKRTYEIYPELPRET